MTEITSNESLIKEIRTLGPWHHDIQINDEISTGKVFSPSGTLPASENGGVSLISPRTTFLRLIDRIYPNGLKGKRFLDCACNAGGYCFWTRERDVEQAVGFDVREHWIKQAEFVRSHRTAGPVDRLQFIHSDLYEIPKLCLGKAHLTYFSGIFYHLPDPITGLKIAADLTEETLILNTSMVAEDVPTPGLTLILEGTKEVMSGVHQLAWLPNNIRTLEIILRWLGFNNIEVKMDRTHTDNKWRRVQLIATR